MNLSKRLSMVSTYVPQDGRLADIGSDHAYLPIDLVEKGIISFAIAGEVAEGPYEHSLTEVDARQLNAHISVRLGDGLSVIEQEDDISVITIAGMGGALIRNILDEGLRAGRLSGKERLILQPNVGEHLVRKWLKEQKYQIIAENIVAENKHIYEIIVAEKSESTRTFTAEEVQFGVYIADQDLALFREKWETEINKRVNILKGLDSTKHNHQKMIQLLQEEIHTIKERLEK